MKKFLTSLILLALFGTSTALLAQYQSNESLGLPGDNLNLYAVMKLFQESETLEGFEKNLNDQNTHINNLDLNGDNKVDYIRVIDNVDGDVHTIVLQVAINRRENQDVAVFTVQRYSDGQVRIQLIGDEALYGKDYIIEPNYADANAGQTPNPGYRGNNNNVTIVTTTPYEVAVWPVVRFIYMPTYVTWHSSWYYDYYPSYWNPWQPYYWDYYYGYQYNWYNDYYGHYRRTQEYRYTHYNDFYYSSRRSQSPNVSVRIRQGDYKATYSRPDQRKDGEELYKRTNPGQNARRSDQPSGNNSGNNAGSRSNTNSSTERQSSGTNANRRSTNTGTNQSETRQAPQQNTNTRRSTNTGTNQSETRQAPQQNNNTPRRATNAATSQPETKQAPQQSTGNTRRVPNSAASRPESKSAPASVPETRTNQRSNSSQPARAASQPKEQKSAPPAVNSSSRRSRTETKSAAPAKESKSSTESKPSRPERRNQ